VNGNPLGSKAAAIAAELRQKNADLTRELESYTGTALEGGNDRGGGAGGDAIEDAPEAVARLRKAVAVLQRQLAAAKEQAVAAEAAAGQLRTDAIVQSRLRLQEPAAGVPQKAAADGGGDAAGDTRGSAESAAGGGEADAPRMLVVRIGAPARQEYALRYSTALL